METLVLIPQDLSLALRPGGARGREASVSVWTSAEIPRGSLLYPFQGTIRIDKLHVYTYVPDHDVSIKYFDITFYVSRYYRHRYVYYPNYNF